MTNINRNIIATMISGMLLFFGVVSAYYHAEATEGLERPQQELQQLIQGRTEKLRELQEQMRLQTQERRETMPQATSSRAPLLPEEIRERIKEHQERFEAERRRILKEVQERREEFEEMAKEMREKAKEEIEQKRQEFHEKVAQLREERHQVLTEKLSENINRVNQLRSDAALRYLDAISLVLSKIEARTGIVEDATETDLTQVQEAIDGARQRIEEARTTVLAQKSKEYIINIESAETLGQAIRSAMHELRDDHRALREETLRPLRNLIRDVMQTLKSAAEKVGEEGTKALDEEFSETQPEQ